MEETNEPFVCIEVSEKSSLEYLAKQFDALFPGRIIRLIIDGEYSSTFYVGAGVWVNKATGRINQYTFKVHHDTDALEYLDNDQIQLIECMGISLKPFRLINDIYIEGEEYHGIFFSDGTYVIVDQYLIENGKKIADFLRKQFVGEIIIDLTNDEETGLIILKTNKKIFGDK